MFPAGTFSYSERRKISPFLYDTGEENLEKDLNEEEKLAMHMFIEKTVGQLVGIQIDIQKFYDTDEHSK